MAYFCVVHDRVTKTLDVFVEPVEFDSGWLEPTTSLTSGDMGMISARTSGYGYISSTIQRSSMLDPTNPPNPELELERYEWLKTGKLQPSLSHYKLHLATFVNGRPTMGTTPLPPRSFFPFFVFAVLTAGSGCVQTIPSRTVSATGWTCSTTWRTSRARPKTASCECSGPTRRFSPSPCSTSGTHRTRRTIPKTKTTKKRNNVICEDYVNHQPTTAAPMTTKVVT